MQTTIFLARRPGRTRFQKIKANNLDHAISIANHHFGVYPDETRIDKSWAEANGIEPNSVERD